MDDLSARQLPEGIASIFLYVVKWHVGRAIVEIWWLSLSYNKFFDRGIDMLPC